MPPKGSGKSKKKLAVVEIVENGADNVKDLGGDKDQVKAPSKQIQNKKEVSEGECPELGENGEKIALKSDMNGFVNDTEDNVSNLKSGKSQVNAKDKAAISDEKNDAVSVVEAENSNALESPQEEVEIHDEKSKIEEPTKTKRGRKFQPQSKPSESSGETDVLASKMDESVPKKTRGGRNTRQQPIKKVSKEDEVKNEEFLSDVPKSSKVKGNLKQKSMDNDTETVDAGDKTFNVEEEIVEDENVPKKRGKYKAEALLEVKESVPKRARGGRNTRQQSAEDATKEVDSKVAADDAAKEVDSNIAADDAAKEVDSKVAADDPAKEVDSKVSRDHDAQQAECVPEPEKNLLKKGGRKARQQSADNNTKESESKVEVVESIEEKAEKEDTLPEMQENVPKRGRGGRNTRQKSEDTSPEKLISESDEPKKETNELSQETKEVVAKKVKSGRLFKQQPVDALAEIKVGPSQRGGRKRRNVPDKMSEPSEDSPKVEAEFDVKKECRVSILRQKSLDDLAQKNLEDEVKVKSAKGSSKASGRGKRAASEDRGGNKPAKVLKEMSSKSTKKDKIPDVSVLDFSNKSTSPDGKPWNLKIASWNINGVRAWLEKDGMSYLHHEQPDILCVQETKCSEDKLPTEANVENYHCYWLAGDKDGYSGVGLLSKEKPLSVVYGIGKEEHDQEGRVITAEYDKFYVVGAYVPNAGRGLVRLKYREQWDIEFRAYLKKLDEKKPVILCGDLNVAHEEIDLANPKTNKKNAGFTKEERDGFTALLSEGFVDTFRHLYPDQKNAYTFWTYMMNARAKNVGWRLDYFVISKRFTDHLCDSVIRKDVMGSDHCPVSLFLSI